MINHPLDNLGAVALASAEKLTYLHFYSAGRDMSVDSETLVDLSTNAELLHHTRSTEGSYRGSSVQELTDTTRSC